MPDPVSDPASEPILRVSGLSAGYVPGMPIVRGMDMSVAPAAMTVIVGPNGAGKSTLLKAIAGVVPISEGRVEVAGTDITGTPPDALGRHGLAYVPQSDNVFRSLTIRQNIELALRGRGLDVPARLAELFVLFPALADKQAEKAGALSGGQRQFLAVAMALAVEPRLILLDEPSAGLSPKAAAEVLDHARGLTERGVSVLLVEQNVKQALQRGDHCYVLAEGRCQIDAPAADLLGNPLLGEIFLGGKRLAPA